jgi:hypothetical protein
MMYKSREQLENTFNRARWIAIALIGSLFVESFVIEMLRWFVPFNGFAGAENGISPLFQYILMVLGLSDLVFLPFLRRSLLSPRNVSSTNPSVLIPRLMSVTIISLAISNAPALLGLVIFLMWGERLPFYMLWGVSLIFMLVYFPRMSFWEEWVEGGGRMEA